MFEAINQNVCRYAAFSSEELATFNQLLAHKSIAKKQFLLHEGDVCRFEAYIVKGCIKSYFIDSNGFEVILTFGIEDWWVSDIDSFCTQQPSRMFIETIEDSELLLLTHQTKEQLLTKIPKFERVFRLMVQRHLASYQERLFADHAKTAQERYEYFLAKYPYISQRIPQHLIAASLGITPAYMRDIMRRVFTDLSK